MQKYNKDHFNFYEGNESFGFDPVNITDADFVTLEGERNTFLGLQMRYYQQENGDIDRDIFVIYYQGFKNKPLNENDLFSSSEYTSCDVLDVDDVGNDEVSDIITLYDLFYGGFLSKNLSLLVENGDIEEDCQIPDGSFDIRLSFFNDDVIKEIKNMLKESADEINAYLADKNRAQE